MPTDQPATEQHIVGKYNAQASDHSTAIVNVYQSIAPTPVAQETLEKARERLEQLPLEEVPAPAVLPVGSRILYARNPFFVGREEDLREVAIIIKGGGTAAIGQIAVVTGLGGIGKTELVVEFAHRYGRYFEGGVYWLSFASAESVPSEVALCGGSAGMNLRADFSALKIDEQVALVLAAWQSPLPRLLVFDNCEDEQLLNLWRPTTGGCRVLVTSRRNQWDLTLGVRTLALGVLKRSESIALLRKFRPDLGENDRGLNEIAHELGDLPLALHLAGSYLKRYQLITSGQPQEYLKALRQTNLLEHPSLQGLKAGLSPTGHETHVARTFAVSYERLQADDALDATARALLQRATCFAPGESIPRELLKQTPGSESGNGAEAEDGLRRLGELGLLEEDAAGDVRLHRLLAAFVQALGVKAEIVDRVEETLFGVAAQINRAGLPAPLLAWQTHLRWAADAAAGRESALAGRLSNELGYHRKMIGDYAGARAAHERALRLDEAAFGPDHPTVAADVNNLGMVLQDLGDYAGARAAYERALRLDEAAFGPDHPNVARDVNNLGMVLKALGDYAGARAALERALRITEAAFGPDHPTVAIDVNNLGMVLKALGDYAGARAALERALRITEAAFGPDHPTVAIRVNNLGLVLQDLGDYAGARAALERALRLDEAAFGPDHPTVARDVNNLGLVLQDLGDYAGARAAFERALRLDEAAFGPDHPNVAIRVNNLGSVLKALGDYAGARAAFERALRLDEAAFGPDHPTVAIDVNNLGLVLQALGDYAGARAAYERALRLDEAAFGPDHPTVAIRVNNLGMVLQDLGDYAGARAALERALRITEAVLGREHPNTRTVRENLEGLLRQQKKGQRPKLLRWLLRWLMK